MQPPLPVSTLTITTETQLARIHGRPVRIWPASDPRRGRVWKMAFLLIDHMGGKIQGIIMAPDYERLSNIFAEQNIVEITRFTIENSKKDYKVVEHEYSLKLTSEAQLKLLPPNIYDIPLYHFDFKPFEAVGQDITYEKAVLDTIGRISGFSDVRTVLGHTRIQTMYLTDQKGSVMDVTLWADFIDKFDVAMLYEKSKEAPIIIACNGLQINKYQRMYGLKTYTGTRFYFDTDLKEISDYLESTSFDGKPIILHATPELFSRNPPPQALLPKPNPIRVTLGDLNALYLDNFTESLYECAARITHIINPFDWCYRGCTECHRKLDQSATGLYCSNCHVPRRHFIAWYRVRVHVRDQTGAAEFVLLGKTADMIIGTDAVTLKAEQDRQEGNRAAPTLLNILNKAYLFTVSGKQPGGYEASRTYTVTRHEEVPEDMVHLLPDPILLLQYPPPQQQTAAPTPSLTLPPSKDGQTTPDQCPSDTVKITETTEKNTGKRSTPETAPENIPTIKTARRRLDFEPSPSDEEKRSSSDIPKPESEGEN